MECLFILCYAPCHTKAVLEMVDCFFNVPPDFVCGISAAQMWFATFPFYRKRRIFGTAGDTIFIERTVWIFRREPLIKGGEGFFKRCILQKLFVNLSAVKSSISQKSLKINQRVFYSLYDRVYDKFTTFRRLLITSYNNLREIFGNIDQKTACITTYNGL